MCETKQPPEACNFWECQHYATTPLWCEYNFTFFLYFILWMMFMQKYIYNSFMSSTLQLSLTLAPIGCFRGNQNQLCWLPYSPSFFWICEQIWPPCSRGHRSKVSTLFSMPSMSGWKKILAWCIPIFCTKLRHCANLSSYFTYEQLRWKDCLPKDSGKDGA